VQPEQGFVEYKIIMQHRESWQQIGALLTSKADVQLYAYELGIEMEMSFESPPLPVILDRPMPKQNNNSGDAVERAALSVTGVPDLDEKSKTK